MRAFSNRPWSMFVLGVTLLLMASLSRGGSIFDDDYTPPKRAEAAPEQPAPTPPETLAVPAPTNPAQPVTRPPDVPVPAPANPADNTAHRGLPDKESRVKCRKLFEEAFAAELKDHSPTARRKLAQRLLDEAGKTAEGSPDRYMLLIGAIQAAEEGQSLRMCFAAAKLLAKEYGVDELATKADAAAKTFAGAPSSALSSIANTELLLTLADQLVAEDALTTVGPVESALQRAAGGIPDPDLKKEVAEQIREEAAIREAHDKLAPALAKLKQSPGDPAANLAVGSYLCFQRGQWDKGLPMLAKSSDTQLKSLATNELAASAGGDAVVKAADGWYDAIPKLAPADRPKAMQHAGALDRVASTSLVGLQKLVIEKRIAQIPPPSRFRRVDLLGLFDPATCTVSGGWKMDDGILISDPSGFNRAAFPYTPPGEYDFRISFTTVHIADSIGQICYCLGHQFDYQIASGGNNTVAAFELVNGAEAGGNKTTKRQNRWLADGKHYVSMVKVRKTGVEAYLDGQLITGLKTDFSDLSLPPGWQISRPDVVGMVTDKDLVRFDRVEIIEITGEGKLLSGK